MERNSKWLKLETRQSCPSLHIPAAQILSKICRKWTHIEMMSLPFPKMKHLTFLVLGCFLLLRKALSCLFLDRWTRSQLILLKPILHCDIQLPSLSIFPQTRVSGSNFLVNVIYNRDDSGSSRAGSKRERKKQPGYTLASNMYNATLWRRCMDRVWRTNHKEKACWKHSMTVSSYPHFNLFKLSRR